MAHLLPESPAHPHFLDLILHLPFDVCHHLEHAPDPELVHFFLELAHHPELEEMTLWRMKVDIMIVLALVALVDTHT